VLRMTGLHGPTASNTEAGVGLSMRWSEGTKRLCVLARLRGSSQKRLDCTHKLIKA